MKQFFAWIALLQCLVTTTRAQAINDTSLFRQLVQADSIVFDEGFNKCRIDLLQKIMHPDLQFLHDQNGAQNREEFFKVFQQSICDNPNQKPIRKLVPGSVKIYPLMNNGQLYGALQTGIHEFFIAEPGKPLRYTVTGSFIHTWLLVNGQWQLYRVVSYDHHTEHKYAAAFEDGYPFPLFSQDREIEQLLQTKHIASVSIGYIANGRLQQLRAFGTQRPGVPVATNSIYKVASLTKPVTAMTVLQLVAAGKWRLDEPLSDYYTDPDLKASPWLHLLTTRNVLCHKSGLPNWRYLRADKKLAFGFEPGTKFQYSGEGYECLRKALEQKFHCSLEDLAGKYLFRPLKMKDTYYTWSAKVDEGRYAVESDTLGIPLPFEKYTTPNAAANLLTTIQDYARFLSYIADSAGLPPALYRDFINPQSEVKAGIYWGLGMQIFPGLPGNEYALIHTGGDYGTKCIALLLPVSKRGLVIFSNSENGMILWKKIIQEYLGAAGAEIVRRNLEE